MCDENMKMLLSLRSGLRWCGLLAWWDGTNLPSLSSWLTYSCY